MVKKKGKEYLLGSRMGQLQLLEKFPTYVKERQILLSAKSIPVKSKRKQQGGEITQHKSTKTS